MLRLALLAFAILLTVAGLVGLSADFHHGWPMAVWGVVLLLSVLFERWRYTRAHGPEVGGSDWQETGERFVDPESGATLRVLSDAKSGERRYVPLADEEPPA